MPGCAEVSRRLSEARDSGARPSPSVRLHLLICSVCRRVRAQFELIGLLASSAEDPRAFLPEAVKERLRRLLRS
jgi:predicted anti-sigma-YlaC factor YlaD